jgi:hypothetical protein
MVAVKKRLRAVLTFCLVCLAAPVAAQLGSATPTPATTDKTATPSATAPEARSPNAKISQNLAQRRIGLVCSIYAGKFDWWTLTLRITQYSTMGLAENCDEQHYDSLTLASMEAQLRAVQRPLFVVRGGAHRYVMDVNLATLPNPFIRIGELLFSAVSEVRINLLSLIRMENYIPDNLIASNYRPFTMHGSIQYIWNIGKPIHRLVAPNGDRYVMYGYTTRVIKQLTQANLAEMGPLLNKPEGWTYESFLLDKTLTIKTTPSNGFKLDFLFDDANNLYIKHDD